MVDLHTHSTYSDGSYTPKDLMEYAHQNGLKAIALTDHDDIGGLKEAEEKACELGIQFIPGVELEVQYTGGEFHLLGLAISKNLTRFEEVLQDIQTKRKNRNNYIIEKIQAAGIKVSLKDIEKYAGGNIISRLHFAHFLIAYGLTKTVKQAFAKYLNPGKPFYVAKEVLTLKKALKLIKESDGKSIVAHPFTLRLSWIKLKKYLLGCKEAGLDGIEAYHPDIAREEGRKLESFGRDHDLIITAGSDFHGKNRAERLLGFSSSGMEIEDRFSFPFLPNK
jgi:predicted metal-dependent phosphoesterase TrpH